MTITFHDRAPLEKVRRLADGRIAAVAKFARSGVYRYSGAEVGRPDLATVSVYRPEAEVFDHAAMASFAHKAITVGHPATAVTADNWKQHSAGWTEGKVARDGEYVEIPLMLADASAVQAYDSGMRELSAGYTCELVWGDGITPAGERYQAKQTAIRGDHIAIVAAGRAGSEARLGDAATAPDGYQQSVEALNGWRVTRDVMLAVRCVDSSNPEVARIAAQAAYDRSKAALNDWRNEPKPAEPARISMAAARYL